MNPQHVRGRPRDLGPNDEVGTPDEHIERCDEHDTLYRRGERCFACERADGDAPETGESA